ncbi:MAG: PIG-L family deacetylase [Chloroflexi bacterium]|nr:PIG-L family deacetylase [Chloroflexota bacterium]MQC48063.1 PIG-L family deacetylase [Chloroflexota bacterium]
MVSPRSARNRATQRSGQTEIDPDADLISEVAKKFGKRALCVFAHPDDLEFSSGGTVSRLCAEGWRVDIVVTTSGNKGTKDPGVTGQMLAGEREEEARHAARIMGAQEPIFLGFHDGGTANDDELRAILVRHIRRLRPELMITWDGFRPGFNHRDHRAAGQATYDAIYPSSDDHLYYPLDKEEGLEPHRPAAMLMAGSNADYHVDISAHFRTKIHAVLAHTSQMHGRTEADMVQMYEERRRQAVDDDPSLPPLRESFVRVIFRR